MEGLNTFSQHSCFDPINLSFKVKERVSKVIDNVECRKYFRFRGGRWYGGIATADVIGCNLHCKFCWAWYFKNRYDLGQLLSPTQAFEKLEYIAKRNNYKLLRLSGGEPTLTRNHLLELVKLSDEAGYTFILETNGILLGYDRSFAKELARFSNIIVRVSFKGTTPEEFELLTGACSQAYEYQFQALRNLLEAGLEPLKEIVVAVMVSFSEDENIAKFILKLASLNRELINSIDWEIVIMYPHVRRLLGKYGLKPKRYINP
ncbi:MAG: molybdenum cofactor biosynthesis protein MoaA [Desulfurococcales archaeon ex4484_42]|nr:MAG: molybdenum cofactor biosynthesis protein MoaA [Desulfurococcales archaeon ex4484_42]